MVELKVNAGTIASPPAGRSRAARPIISPRSQLATARTRGVPSRACACASNRRAYVPKLESMRESQMSRSSST